MNRLFKFTAAAMAVILLILAIGCSAVDGQLYYSEMRIDQTAEDDLIDLSLPSGTDAQTTAQDDSLPDNYTTQTVFFDGGSFDGGDDGIFDDDFQDFAAFNDTQITTALPPFTANTTASATLSKPTTTAKAAINKNGTYTKRDDVALYIHTYGKLPSNFITKKQARKLGWEGGSLEKYAPGKCIGGDRFGNYEGLLPEKKNRYYTECDIDTLGAKSRGAKRIVFSNDGLIYYTDDHYESFTLLYGEAKR